MGRTLRIIGVTMIALLSLGVVRPANACKQPLSVAMPGVHEWLRKARATGHPLAGRAFSSGVPMPTSRDDGCGESDPVFAVVNRAAMSPLANRGPEPKGITLVGEVHDNPWHHELQGEVLRRIRSLLAETPTHERAGPAAVFEHIRTDQQPALDLFSELMRNGQHLDRPAEFFRFLKWDQSGWPDKALFQPLFRAAIEGRHPILPGDPPRETIRATAKGGMAGALPADEIARLKLDQPLEPKVHEALLTELEASHCGLVPKAAFATMADAQRYRDAHLADALVKAAAKHGSALLFAGNGHVRSDRGVPYHLRRLAPDKPILAVLLLEVEAGKTDPAAYFPRDPEGRPVADFIIFTPRAERQDPCVEMRERFGRKQPN